MVERFPNYETEVGSHPNGCNTKDCKNKKKLDEKLCQECLYTEKFSKVFSEINELQNSIQKKEEELFESDTDENYEKINNDIVMLKEILEILKQKIRYDSETVSDNRKIYKGKNQDGQQVILETHCTIVRVSNSPENVYFGHVTLEISYLHIDTKYKWHYGIKTFDQLPEKLKSEFWQPRTQTYRTPYSNVSKYGAFSDIKPTTTLADMMMHHFIKCFDYFTKKSQWDKQIWYKKDLVGDEAADTVLGRLKQENDIRQSVNVEYYEEKWSKFKETEQKRKEQERELQERELQERERERRERQERERRERERQERERERERQANEQPLSQSYIDHLQHKRDNEDKESEEYRIKEQARKENAAILAKENLEAENTIRAQKALKEEEKKNVKLRALEQRAYIYRGKQNKLNETKYEQARREQEDSEFFLNYLEQARKEREESSRQTSDAGQRKKLTKKELTIQREKEEHINTYLKKRETEERIVLQIEEKLKKFSLMSQDAYDIRKSLSKIYNSTIENVNRNIDTAENDKDLNTENKSKFLKILKNKIKDTEKLLHLLHQKDLAYDLNLRIQKIEDHYNNIIAPTEKKLKTLKYEEGSGLRRFLINYYRNYEDSDSEYKSIISETRRGVSEEEYINIRNKLIKLVLLINHRERLEELCKLETPLIIDYYKFYDDSGDEDNEFIISQLFILHPSFFTKDLAEAFVAEARKKNKGILSTKYFIEFFPKGFTMDSKSFNQALAIFKDRTFINHFKV